MSAPTILRTGAGSAVAPVVIAALRAAGARVIAADMNPLSVGFASADRALVIPRADSQNFVPALLAACRTEAVDVLFPDVDEEFLPIARARSQFEALGVRVLLSSTPTLERCLDKRQFAAALGELGLPSPRIFAPAELAGALAFPLFIKPRAGRGSAGATRIDDPAALARARAEDPDAVVMEHLPGREFSIDTLSTLAGGFLYASVRERLATDSGISVKGRTLEWPALEDLARQVVDGLGVIGPCCLQGILDGAGRPRFTDCNPRLGGGAALSVAAGAPIFDDLVRLVRGEAPVGKRAYRAGLVMLRSWHETYVDPLAQVRAVAFDLDDTLYDRRAHLAGAWAMVAAALASTTGGDRAALADSLAETWRALGSDHPRVFDHWLAGLGLDPAAHVRACVEAFHAYVPPVGALTLAPGVADALAALRARNIPIAIVTDGRAASQAAKVRALGLEALVDEIVYCGALGAPKPEAAGAHEVARRLRVPIGALLVVGDHPRFDVVMARRAGALAARVFTGEFADRPDDVEATADLACADVPGLVRRLLAVARTG
jgi:carbamoyl-phosphate synthase large subunit